MASLAPHSILEYRGILGGILKTSEGKGEEPLLTGWRVGGWAVTGAHIHHDNGETRLHNGGIEMQNTVG